MEAEFSLIDMFSDWPSRARGCARILLCRQLEDGNDRF